MTVRNLEVSLLKKKSCCLASAAHFFDLKRLVADLRPSGVICGLSCFKLLIPSTDGITLLYADAEESSKSTKRFC